MKRTTVIKGYTVEINTYTDMGEKRVDCTVIKGKYSSGLCRLEDIGTLYDNNMADEVEVDPQVVEEIVTWAEAHGH